MLEEDRFMMYPANDGVGLVMKANLSRDIMSLEIDPENNLMYHFGFLKIFRHAQVMFSRVKLV